MVSLSGSSCSAFSRRNPGASSLGPSSPRVLELYAPSQSSGSPMVPPLSSASPVPGLPLSAVSHFCTFAQELRSDLHLCTSCSGPPVLQSSCPLAVSLPPHPPPLNLTPPQQPQPFRMPGKAKSQTDDNHRQPWRQGQGNSDQARDDQNRSRDHPGRLDNAEHTFKVSISPTTQATPPLYAWVGMR